MRPARPEAFPMADPVTFHDVVGASFVLPGRSLNQDRNHRQHISNHLLRLLRPPNAGLSSSFENIFMPNEILSVSRAPIRAPLHLFPTNRAAPHTSQPIIILPPHKKQEQLKKSFSHTQTSPPFSSTIIFGPQAQRSHDAIGIPPRS
jgi:hypothetical protein